MSEIWTSLILGPLSTKHHSPMFEMFSRAMPHYDKAQFISHAVHTRCAGYGWT